MNGNAGTEYRPYLKCDIISQKKFETNIWKVVDDSWILDEIRDRLFAVLFEEEWRVDEWQQQGFSCRIC